MVNAIKLGGTIFLIMILAVGLNCVGLLTCWGKGESEPAGWQTFQVQGWSISFPGNWRFDANAGIGWPGESDLNMGRPVLSVHCGGMPLMPNTNFEDRVISHINAAPRERKNVSISGFSGFKCSWEARGKKHLGLFLEEKMGGGMGIIHFVDCQAPGSDFDQHKGDFQKIIGSLKK